VTDKRKAIFLGYEERVVHNQIVKVKVYGEIDPEPELAFDDILRDICGASASKLDAIKKLIEEYKHKVLLAEFPDFHNTEFIHDDTFLDTASENAMRSLKEYQEETMERYAPLDVQLRELGIE